MIINKTQLRRTLGREVPKAIGKRVFAELEQEFEKAKRILLAEFEEHAVSRELKGKSGSTNLTNTLGGEGNLYSFIGFSGEDALGALRDLLENNIKIISKKTDRHNLTFSVKIAFPNSNDIGVATPMPWAPGMSWAEGIERGISGLGNYLAKDSPVSRSGKGIQVDVQVRGGTFSPTEYMTGLLRDFVNALTKEIK
jgi:hypothetical protein